MELLLFVFSVLYLCVAAQECHIDKIQDEISSLKTELLELSFDMDDMKIKKVEPGKTIFLSHSLYFCLNSVKK